MSFVSEAYAQVTQGAATSGDNPLMNFLPLILIFAVFYVLIIRPQQKKLKEHETVLKTLKRGDEVVTGGGVFGKISKIEEGTNIVHVEIAKDVIIRVNKSSILDVVPEAIETPAEKSKPKSKPEKKTKANS